MHYLREQVLGFTEARRNLPDAAYDLLSSAGNYPPPQVKYLKKAQAKYVQEMIKRGWLEVVDPGGFQEAVKTTKAGKEALSKGMW